MTEVREIHPALDIGGDYPYLQFLRDYENISIAFEVKSILILDPISLSYWEQSLAEEHWYTKDYDEYEQPFVWAQQWNLENWGFLLAFDSNILVGGALIALTTEGLRMLEGRNDLAVLWDIRVDPTHRGKGAGKKIFEAAVAWSRQKGCKQLKIETQNNNVAACKFYEKMGARIAEINSGIYPEFPDEVQIIWRLELK